MDRVIDAFLKALGQLFDGAVVRYVGLSVLLAALVYALLFTGIWFLLHHTALFELAWLETIVDVLGGLAAVILALLLFPAVFGAVLSLFLEGVARAVERRHYPALPKAPGARFWAGLWSAVRLLVVIVVVNVLLLLLLLVPPVYPVAYYLANGYLLGREYFEMVALRRLEPPAMRALRARRGSGTLLFGMVFAFLLTIPVVNLVAPVLGTMAMVHLFERWRRAA